MRHETDRSHTTTITKMSVKNLDTSIWKCLTSQCYTIKYTIIYVYVLNVNFKIYFVRYHLVFVRAI